MMVTINVDKLLEFVVTRFGDVWELFRNRFGFFLFRVELPFKVIFGVMFFSSTCSSFRNTQYNRK
jgi:hypothetical protein